MFFVLSGRLDVQLRNRTVRVGPGQLYVIPKGTEHCPKAEEPTEFMILGRSITSNTEGGKPN